jgi:NAD(P)-dependent dehydrogenase (short-subunit alcohol dehydrogenase family)
VSRRWQYAAGSVAPRIGGRGLDERDCMGTIVITGSAGGIGIATRARLEKDGHRVIGVDVRNAEVIADLSTAAGRAAMVTAVTEASGGVLDGVVAGAGISGDDGPLTMSINYFGAWATLDGLRPLLARGTNPGAVAISSNSTTTTLTSVVTDAVDACLAGDEERARGLVTEGWIAYPTAKLALARWVRRNAPAPDWIGSGIRLNAIAPGPIATPMTDPISEMVLGMGDAYPVPIGRLGTADEVAAVIQFLLSPDASYVVGSLVFVDGGGHAAARSDDSPRARLD